MFVITGCQVMDGDAYSWVVDVVNEKYEANATMEHAINRWEEDYGENPLETGVDFTITELEGRVQR